jgi:uncharacterized protein (DUF1778 family)
VETKETQTISLRLNLDEVQLIDDAAQKAGQTRPDYIRTRLLVPDETARITRMERQLKLLADRLEKEAERQEARRCTNPEHAKVWGAGHCFDCDMPMGSGQ